MMSNYGSAIVVKTESGSLVVHGIPDKTIGVTAELYEAMLPGHRHDDGTIQLDCAGHYRSRRVGEYRGGDVLVFELLPDASEHYGHHPDNHHPATEETK